MSNVLKVSLQTTIYSLADSGWSQRRIANELRINRETVGRYLRLKKPAISIAGSEEGSDRKPAISIAGKEQGDAESKPAISITGVRAGRRSHCEPLAKVIAAKVEAGLSAQRIYQELVEQNDFKHSYQSVQRFVRKLKRLEPQRIWRVEAQPGEEVQVDFGLGAPICEGTGRRRRSWVFRMVLSYSRKAYTKRFFVRTPKHSCAVWKADDFKWTVFTNGPYAEMLYGGNFLRKILDDGTRVFAAPLGKGHVPIITLADLAASWRPIQMVRKATQRRRRLATLIARLL